MRSRRRGERQAAADGKEEDEDGLPMSASTSKRAKVDHDDQVDKLFGAAPVFDDQ